MPAHLKIQCHIEEMPLPQRGHETDAGLDLTAFEFEEKKENVFFFNTGISIHISEGYYAEIVPRSSIVKTDFIMANSIGIIDPDYRGLIYVSFRYVGNSDPFTAAKELLKKRIAQLIIRRLEPCSIEIVSSLANTERGKGGFGSTGM